MRVRNRDGFKSLSWSGRNQQPRSWAVSWSCFWFLGLNLGAPVFVLVLVWG